MIQVYTVVAGYHDLARVLAMKAVSRFERVNGCHVLVLERSNLPDDVPLANEIETHYARYAIWRCVPSTVDRVLYFDTDIVAIRPLPRELPTVDFLAAPDPLKKSSFWSYLKNTPIFNSGLFIATRKTTSIFNRVGMVRHSKPIDRGYDQPDLNVEVRYAERQQQLTVGLLPKEWNQLVLDPEPCARPYNLHWAGWEAPGRLPLVAMLVDELDRWPMRPIADSNYVR